MKDAYRVWKVVRPIIALGAKYGYAVFSKVLDAVADMEERGDLANEEKRRRVIASVVFFAAQLKISVSPEDIEKLIKIAIILIRLKRAANA